MPPLYGPTPKPGEPKVPRIIGNRLKCLQALAGVRGPGGLSLNTLVEYMELTGAHAAPNLLQTVTGYVDEEKRAARERTDGYLSLLSLGYISSEDIDVAGRIETIYRITPLGRKALQAAIES